jgi:hypothetical protein
VVRSSLARQAPGNVCAHENGTTVALTVRVTTPCGG